MISYLNIRLLVLSEIPESEGAGQARPEVAMNPLFALWPFIPFLLVTSFMSKLLTGSEIVENIITINKHPKYLTNHLVAYFMYK